MVQAQHLFVTPGGEMLPRWQHAFADATAVSAADLPLPTTPKMVWMRLRAGTSSSAAAIAQQIEATRQRVGDAALVVLSDTPNDDEAMAAFSASARGYCNSHATPEVLRQIATVVSQGGLWIGESLMERLLVGINRLPQMAAASGVMRMPVSDGRLTEREWEVAQAVAGGASNKEIGRRLGITERTVKAHISVIFAKLDVQDRLQLALKMRATQANA
jgi:DNA-binding NarL/FixJ family response regulator